MTKEFICIVCPRGCHVSVDEQMNITGNQCKRGETYVLTELKDPKRILTTTVRTIFPETPRVSVKTSEPIPKGLIYEIMDLINDQIIEEPMSIGDVLIKNVLDTGADIVLTKSCMK